MYESVTYEQILKRMLERVPAKLDKREGSVIYTALAPAAAELQIMYIELGVILKEMFADTASREYLIKRAAERGLVPSPPSPAVFKGEFNMDIPLGSRFSKENLNYTAIERIGAGVYKMECETVGAAGNTLLGPLIPIEYIKGLTRAELTELLIPGEDEEETEHFRSRYFGSLNSQAFGGNAADYKEKVNALPGIGGVKVYPVWNGGGTVKLVVINSGYGKPSEELIREVQETIDPAGHSGEGWGLAPIGHKVTVAGVQSTAVDIEAVLEYQAGWTWEDIEKRVQEKVDDYFLDLSAEWAETAGLIVRVSRMEMLFLDTAGVVDVRQVLINGEDKNLALGENEVPVRGRVHG